MRWQFWRRQRPTTPFTVFDPKLSADTYVAYHDAVRSVLVCDKCGWNWGYHDDGDCPTPAQAQRTIEVDGR